MKSIVVLVTIWAVLAGCGTENRPSAPRAGILTVYVHAGPEPLQGKTVEVLDTGETGFTDSRGIARFVLPAGDYTVRVREITRPGPGPGYVDTRVTIVSGGTVGIEVEDCPECVGA